MTNGHYDQRRPGKLAPYEKVVIQMRSQGMDLLRWSISQENAYASCCIINWRM